MTVQNLTVRPEMLSYDAAGTARQQAALVGSPLTVTASTSLGDLKAERVVTDDEDTGTNVTNGVLGRGADGTSVQWAALLAPPMLQSSSEFSLVLDAEDFDVPTIDLSVQPGLVTDPSMGALVDSAFNPAGSEELDLQRRTIDLIGEVNLVLTRASDTISDVRTSLTSSAETLGTQTVSDLQSSTQSVTSNMSSLDSALQSLRQDLSSTLESTGSSAVAELDQAVTVVDQLLGDTSAQVPTTGVRGSGCDTTVEAPRKGTSVYGNLLQVASQLDAYAQATGECKGALQASILKTIGDANPTPTQCDGVTSVTCSLQATKSTFDLKAEELRTELLNALDALNAEEYQDAVDAAVAMLKTATGEGAVDGDPESIKAITDAIKTRRGDLVGDMNAARIRLAAADRQLASAQSELTTGLATAEAVRGELTSMAGQSTAAATEVCRLVEAGTLTRDEARKTLSYLVPQASCADGALSPDDTDADGNLLYPGPLASRLEDQGDALDDSIGDVQGAAQLLTEGRGNVTEALAAVDRALDIDCGDEECEDADARNLRELFIALDGAFARLDRESGDLADEIEDIEDLKDQADAVRTTINEAVDEARADVKLVVQEESGKIVEAGEAASTELGDMFQRSSDGLKSAGDDVVRNGKKSVNEQKSAFEKARDASANRVTSVVEDGLVQINTGVSSSTRDMEAATALLTADLRKVLLDLGQREVGGGGLLGAMATNAATARTADFQLALAGDKATSYSNVRGRDIEGLMLRQAQTDAAMQSLAEFPAFQIDLPSGSQHRTVYSFRIGDS